MLVSDQDVLTYLKTSGLPVTAAMQGIVQQCRPVAERLVKDYLGYDIEQATLTEYYPEATGNTRADGDETAVGFDLSAGVVVPRSASRIVRRELVLRRLPVRSVVSVYDNPAAWNTAGGNWPASALLPANAYFLDDTGDGYVWSGILYRNVGQWSYAARSVKITYTAGLTAAELRDVFPNIKLAVQIAVAKQVADAVARSRTAVTGFVAAGVTIQDFSVTFAQPGMAGVGSFTGAGVSSVALPTESAQLLADYRHPARLV